MEDGKSNITLELRKNGTASIDGLYGNKVEGTWETERVELRRRCMGNF